MAAARPMTAKQRRRRNNLVAYGFMSPWFIGFLCFSAFPILFMLSISLTNRKLTGLSKYIGFKNYINMFNSPTFLNSLKVTLFFTVVMMIITAIWALCMALLLNQMCIRDRCYTSCCCFGRCRRPSRSGCRR